MHKVLEHTQVHFCTTRPGVSSSCPACCLPCLPPGLGNAKTKPCRSLWIPNPKLADFHVSNLALLTEVCWVSPNARPLIDVYSEGKDSFQIPGAPWFPGQPIPGAGNEFPVSRAALQALAAAMRSLTHGSCLPIMQLLQLLLFNYRLGINFWKDKSIQSLKSIKSGWGNDRKFLGWMYPQCTRLDLKGLKFNYRN